MEENRSISKLWIIGTLSKCKLQIISKVDIEGDGFTGKVSGEMCEDPNSDPQVNFMPQSPFQVKSQTWWNVSYSLKVGLEVG